MKAFRFALEVFRTAPGLLLGDTVLLVLESLLGMIAIMTVAPVIDYLLASDLEHASGITVRMAAIMRAAGVPVSLGGFQFPVKNSHRARNTSSKVPTEDRIPRPEKTVPDEEREPVLHRAIESIARETTVIVIVHRLSTIVNADHVYVLRQGRLVEEGTYQELVQQNGYFSRLTQLQLVEAAV